MPAVTRRWFRPTFSLRTLFSLLTVFAMWLGYSLNWKAQREAFLAQHPDLTCEFNDSPPTTLNRWGNKYPVFAPSGMWALGERGLVSLWLPPKVWSAKREAEAARLFPEALLLKVNSKGYWISQNEAGFNESGAMNQ